MSCVATHIHMLCTKYSSETLSVAIKKTIERIHMLQFDTNYPSPYYMISWDASCALMILHNIYTATTQKMFCNDTENKVRQDDTSYDHATSQSSRQHTWPSNKNRQQFNPNGGLSLRLAVRSVGWMDGWGVMLVLCVHMYFEFSLKEFEGHRWTSVSKQSCAPFSQ